MRNGADEPDWREEADYGVLVNAERSLFAWEWLRRDPAYRAAATAARESGRRNGLAAECFGLAAFEWPSTAVPLARPVWLSQVHPFVLEVQRQPEPDPGDRVDFAAFASLATLTEGKGREHLLLSDGLFAVRLDGPPGLFTSQPLSLRYSIGGISRAEGPLLTLRRFLALCRDGRLPRSLHPREARARRWILMLRAWDGLARGADQRAIAEQLISGSVRKARWRTREPSVRLQVQRLLRSARLYAGGGYRSLLK